MPTNAYQSFITSFVNKHLGESVKLTENGNLSKAQLNILNSDFDSLKLLGLVCEKGSEDLEYRVYLIIGANNKYTSIDWKHNEDDIEITNSIIFKYNPDYARILFATPCRLILNNGKTFNDEVITYIRKNIGKTIEINKDGPAFYAEERLDLNYNEALILGGYTFWDAIDEIDPVILSNEKYKTSGYSVKDYNPYYDYKRGFHIIKSPVYNRANELHLSNIVIKDEIKY